MLTVVHQVIYLGGGANIILSMKSNRIFHLISISSSFSNGSAAYAIRHIPVLIRIYYLPRS